MTASCLLYTETSFASLMELDSLIRSLAVKPRSFLFAG